MLRQLNIPADWVATGETGTLAMMLGSSLDPEQARELQGTIAFMFPELEVDDVRIFDTPGVVEWLALIHRLVPHLAYFLEPSPLTGALEGLLRTLMPGEQRAALAAAEGVQLTEEILSELVDRLVACALFATDMGDDWEPIVARFVDPLDENAQKLLVEVVRKRVD